MAETEGKRFETIANQPKKFTDAKFADVFAARGELGVDVKDLDAVVVFRQAAQKQFDHVALAMQRRGRLRKDDNFHLADASKTESLRDSPEQSFLWESMERDSKFSGDRADKDANTC
jgi:hypothetical protein